MHSDGVFHSDLKTCNILVSEESSPTSEQCEDGETAEVRFSLLDYDDVTFGRCVCTRRRIKNLVQIFLSTPIALAARDRLRFLNAYASASGLKRRTRREIARQVLERARGKEILYVGFDGDIIEKWDI
jgi:serine/threonine protein kinase